MPEQCSIPAMADTLKAAADSLRLQVLRALKSHSLGVLELCELFQIKQSGMSHHLKVLAGAGLVTRHREGNFIFYRRALAAEQAWLQGLFDALDQAPLQADVQLRLQVINQTRAEQSQAFFARHAEDFQQQQDLIAEYHQYGATAEALLLDAIPSISGDTAIEIGPGNGEYLLALSDRFKRVIAVDNSDQMLSKAQQHVAQTELTNIDFILGESSDLLELQQTAEAVVCNMVLHHVPSPAEVIEHAGQLVSAGGQLLITELCSHQQNWARESCGDLWLGFEPQQLDQWAASAHFKLAERQYLGLRNGFQVQICRYIRQPDSTALAA